MENHGTWNPKVMDPSNKPPHFMNPAASSANKKSSGNRSRKKKETQNIETWMKSL